ncbi:MAG: hypothetical protein ACT4QC_11255 [Planctomycetaceae bacterium]
MSETRPPEAPASQPVVDTRKGEGLGCLIVIVLVLGGMRLFGRLDTIIQQQKEILGMLRPKVVATLPEGK